MKYTIKDIAHAAGVSITTVSLVINGKAKEGRIHPDTEQKILLLVEQLRYQPSKSAQRLRTQKSDIIGFVMPDATNPFFANLTYALEQTLKKHGYQLLIGYSNDQPETEAEVIHNLLAYTIDGLIIAGASNSEDGYLSLKAKVPTVFIDREINSINAPTVSSDNFQGAFEAVNYLCSLGVADIYHISGLKNLSTTQQRLAGHLKALEHNGIPVDETKIYLRNFDSACGYEMMREICDRNHGLPEAIFTGSYSLLEGCLCLIRDRCGSVPQELYIATFDDHPLLDFMPFNIVSVRQETEQLAQEALHALFSQKQGAPVTENRKVKPTLIIRQ